MGKHNLNNLIIEFREIICYCNNIFRDISFTYNTVQYGFNDSFIFIRVEKEKKCKKKASADDSDSDSDGDIKDIKKMHTLLDSLK